jgi:DNA-binding GntR family transcriptional regulator
VREAIAALHARGLVEVIQNRGARVRRLSEREVREAYVVRAELEGLAAALAAELASDEQVERLKTAEALFAQALVVLTAGDDAGRGRDLWHRANNTFHDAVLQAADNATLRSVIEGVYERIPRNLTWAVLGGEPRRLRANIAEHRMVREAIERGDAVGARRAMTDHVLRSAELVARRSD